jgi:hypothetical protein
VTPLGAAVNANPIPIAAFRLTGVGAALLGPNGAVALAPHAVDVLAIDPKTALTTDAEASDLAASAQRMLAAGNASLACPLLERVVAARRTPDALFALSRCYESTGQLASAWLASSAVADVATDQATRASASTMAARLAAGLPHLTFAIASQSGGGAPQVTFDGHAVAPDQWGKPLPLDPGRHTVIVHGAGQPDVERSIDVAKGSKDVVVAWPEAPATPPPPSRPWYVSDRVLIMGVVTLAMGAGTAVAGVLALNKKSDFDAHNGQPGNSSKELTDMHDTARGFGIGATAFLGLTAIAFGTTALFANADSREAPPSSPPPVNVGAWLQPGGGGLVVGGKL